MYNKILLSLVAVAMLCMNVATAQENNLSPDSHNGHDGHDGHDGHALIPISVMGAHTHKKGEVMLSYRYMPMWMKGNLESSDEISNEEIYENFMIAPQEMKMDMHMLGFMYAPSNRLTLMLMANYISNSMDLRTGMGGEFTTESGGLGDLTLTGLINIINKDKQTLLANVGISIPTGDINQRDATPLVENAPLAYPMQLGSGTWDPILGLTYQMQAKKISWGAQVKYKISTGENDQEYTLGNRFDGLVWGALKASKLLSFSASLSFFNTDSIDGADADLNPMMMPLFDTANSGRSQTNIGLGTNFNLPNGKLKNLRLASEVHIPIQQKVEGIQMKNTVMATFGIQYNLGHSHSHTHTH